MSKETKPDNFNPIPSILKLSLKSKNPNKQVALIEEIVEKAYNLEDKVIENSIKFDHFDDVLANIDHVFQN